MSLSLLALAMVMSALPRWHGCVALGATACAVGGFVVAFTCYGTLPGVGAVALVIGASGAGTAVSVIVEGLSRSLSFVPAEFSWGA